MESMARVTRPDNIATNAAKGNLCHGLSLRHSDDSISKESGKTCMNPVPSMIPEEKHFIIVKMLPSERRKGIERLNRGVVTPIKLVAKMATMAMILRGNAFALLMHGSFEALPQPSGPVEIAGDTVKATRMRMM